MLPDICFNIIASLLTIWEHDIVIYEKTFTDLYFLINIKKLIKMFS